MQIQALIGRLQIPVLKTALHDRSFFSDPNHPLRRLINEIASACIGWSETDKHIQDKLFDKISEVVKSVHDNYAKDENVFGDELKELQQYVKQENRKSSLVEKRASEAAVGQVRTDHARGIIKTLLQERMQGKKLPSKIISFLNNDWHNVLFLINLREGEESEKWLDALQIVNDLIWSVQPHNDEKSQRRLEHLLPSLHKRIVQFLPLAITSPEANLGR